METKHVYLGRFAPLHNGHKRLILRLIERFGKEKVLILIGSSNSISKRTPYTYEDRAEILKASFPDLEVLPLPDGKPNLEYFDGSTNDLWLNNIDDLAKARKEKFVFYGGSEDDLKILSEKFETEVIIDRLGEGEGLSATIVRDLIVKNNVEELKKYVDEKAINLILEKYIKI